MLLHFERKGRHETREAARLRFFVLRRRTLTLAAAALAAVGIFTAVNAPAAVRASVATRQLPIYCVERDQKVCSISFDAAWGDGRMRQCVIPPRQPPMKMPDLSSQCPPLIASALRRKTHCSGIAPLPPTMHCWRVPFGGVVCEKSWQSLPAIPIRKERTKERQ